MRHGFVIALVATLFVACNNDKKDKDATTTTDNTGTTTTTNTTTNTAKTWDEPTRTAFVTNCTNESKTRMNEEQAREYCNCMLDKIVAKYPNPDNANNMTIQETQDMAKTCVN